MNSGDIGRLVMDLADEAWEYRDVGLKDGEEISVEKLTKDMMELIKEEIAHRGDIELLEMALINEYALVDRDYKEIEEAHPKSLREHAEIRVTIILRRMVSISIMGKTGLVLPYAENL